MRPTHLAPVGPALVLALFALAWAGGSPEEVRRSFAPWLPALAAFVGALGPMLLAQGRISRPAARAVVLAALGALGAFALLVILVPFAPGEPAVARLWPGLDAVFAGALVASAALGVRRPYAVATWVLSALALARALGAVTSSLATGVLVPENLLGAAFWAGAALIASALAAARFMRSARAATRA
jgi:hypothetical protein